MAFTYDELKHKKVSDLRKIASDIDHPAVQGYSQLNKDHLLEAICKALDIDMFEHHTAHLKNKGKIKARIKKMKEQRDKALEKKDDKKYREAIKVIHDLKRVLRRAAK